MLELTTYSETETKDIGIKLAKILNKNSIISLTGELGAGKTVMMSGVAKYFNIEDQVSSPTFTIVNEYTSSLYNIYHFDVYRLSDADEFLELGLNEYFEKGICIVEWGIVIDDILPKNTIKITITKDNNDENIRYIHIEGIDNL